MERTKNCLILCLFLWAISIQALASNKTKIYQAYINNKMDVWKTTIDQMEAQRSGVDSFLIELVNYQYGYIAWCLGNQQKSRAKEYLEMAENNLNTLENQACCPSVIHAYKSAFYGFKIGLAPYKAPFIGPNSMKNAELSIQTDSTNFLGFVQYGNNQFYMPAVFGGSKQKAIESFQKAKNLLEKNPTELKNDWNYLGLIVLIAQSYEELEDLEKAKECYEEVLKIEPGFQWVKNELYPNLLKEIKAQQ